MPFDILVIFLVPHSSSFYDQILFTDYLFDVLTLSGFASSCFKAGNDCCRYIDSPPTVVMTTGRDFIGLQISFNSEANLCIFCANTFIVLYCSHVHHVSLFFLIFLFRCDRNSIERRSPGAVSKIYPYAILPCGRLVLQPTK